MKICCGIEISGNEARFAVAKIIDDEVSHVVIDTKKIALDDDENSGLVKSFAGVVEGFARDNDIKWIAISKRAKKGRFAGGSITFKIEGIFQLLNDCEVILISPKTVDAQDKKYKISLPISLKKYQHEAYRTACTAILQASK